MVKRELLIFLIVGSLTVLVDFFSYRSLVWAGLEISLAKASGFLIGTIFAYFANRLWTFGHKTHAKGSILRFAILYAITLGVNVSINSLTLAMLDNKLFAMQIAFLLATGTSACLNFIGMKFFVFKMKEII